MPVISVENLSKQYRLGQIGGRTLTEDLNRWWARARRKPNPFASTPSVSTRLRIGETDHGNYGYGIILSSGKSV